MKIKFLHMIENIVMTVTCMAELMLTQGMRISPVITSHTVSRSARENDFSSRVASESSRSDTEVIEINSGDKIEHKDIISITFPPKSSKLTKNELQNIKNFIEVENKDDQKIDGFIVSAWCDLEYTDAKQLSDEKKIAINRQNVVVKALNDAGIKSVTVYDMTESPTWIASEAETKGAGRDQTAAATAMNDLGKIIRDKGGPGEVLILVKHKSSPRY